MSRPDRKLYRDTDDQKIGGVCSGLARYFDLDPLLVRVAFVAGLVFSGVSLIAYALLWWLVDPAPAGHWSQRDDTLPAPTATAKTTATGPTATAEPTATDATGAAVAEAEPVDATAADPVPTSEEPEAGVA